MQDLEVLKLKETDIQFKLKIAFETYNLKHKKTHFIFLVFNETIQPLDTLVKCFTIKNSTGTGFY